MEVLIVDDSATQRLILKSIINNYSGVSLAHEATDGLKALEILKKHNVDLVFSDINMEPMSGLELISTAKEQKITAVFAFITSHLTESMEKKAREAGGEYYITKPITQEKIEDVLKKAQNA
jgi:YesN/AraC family two-component response regulator